MKFNASPLKFVNTLAILSLLVGLIQPALIPSFATSGYGGYVGDLSSESGNSSLSQGTVTNIEPVEAGASSTNDEQPTVSATSPKSLATAVSTSTLYLPFVTKENVDEPDPSPGPPLEGIEVLVEPGHEGELADQDGGLQITLSKKAVEQPTWMRYEPLAAPTIVTPNLGVGGSAFAITAWQAGSGEPVTQFPHDVRIVPGSYNHPAYAVMTPSLVITMSYSEAEVWGLDERTLSLYSRADASQPWQRVPTAVYPEQQLLRAEIDHLSQFVPLATLAVSAAATGTKRLVLDPDDNVGHATWPPPVGYVTETPFSVRLNQVVKQRFEADGCGVDILLTRESEGESTVSRSLRADMAKGFDSEMFATMTFNAFSGSPWGLETNGGIVGWARGGADDALVTEFYNRIQEYTGRPHRRPVEHPAFYPEFESLPGVYAHIETLFLDHNYDFPLINAPDGFDAIANAAYAALRTQLEPLGLICSGDPTDPGTPGPTPPPLPAPPSAEQLQRWRDLGYQNLQTFGLGYPAPFPSGKPYQEYGGDPVSFSTGNHIIQVHLARIPGRGGLDIDLTLTYNAQDGREDLFGYGWSLPYNARVFHYNDDSASIVLHDGRTYHYTWNGNSYDPPPGVFDELEQTAEGWRWTAIQNQMVLSFTETVGGLGILNEWQDRQGNALHFTYDLSGQDNWKSGGDVPRPPLTAIEDDAGRVFTITTTGDGYIEQIDLPDGRFFGFTYDGGDLIEIRDGNGGVRQYEYDERHRMTHETDPEGILYLQNIYDDRDRVEEQIDADQIHSYLAYDPVNGETIFTDNLGNETTYFYDDLNRITAEEDSEGNRTAYEYDAAYNVTKMTDARGNETHHRYDGQGNLIERRDPVAACSPADYSQDVTTWSYNGQNDLISMTDALSQTTTFDYDSQGNLTAIHEPGPRTTSFTYNAWGQPDSMTDANQHPTFYEYDTYGNLTRTTDAEQNVSRSTYDIVGRELTYTDANSHTVTFEYDGNDNITKIIDPKEEETTFVYDKNDLLLESEDRRGVVSHYQYDDNLKLTAERDFPDGAWLRYDYDELYRRVSSTDRRGYRTRYEYDTVSRLTTIRDPLGGVARYAYDAADNLTAMVSPLGQRTELVYDEMNRLRYLIDAAGERTEYCYDAKDRLLRVTGPRGEVTRYAYDAVDSLVEIRDPLAAATRYEYDRVANLIAVIDAKGEQTDYLYDDVDRLTSIRQPPVQVPGSSAGQRPTIRFAYDGVGNTTVITSPRGFATDFSYDANDNLAQVTDPLGGQTLYAYDAEDNPISITDARGYTTRFSYNEVGLPIRVEDPLDEATRLAYDADYNLTRLIDALDHAATYEYDALNRLVREIDPLGSMTEYERDLVGNVLAMTDANGHTTRYSYDVLNRLQTVTDALSRPTHYEYDAAGNLTAMTDANNHITRFAYDLRNQLIREINPLGKRWAYSYDAVGNLVERIDGKGDLTRYEYDSHNRLIGLTYPDFSNVRFGYDPDGNEVSMCDWLAEEGACHRTTYDALNRPLSSSDWLDRTIRRSYDAVGNLTELIYPNGQPVGYDYDARNQLVRLEDHFGQQIVYRYDPVGQLTDIARPNGTSSAYEYDPANRLTGITHRQGETPFAAFAYALDRVGNRTQIAELRTFTNDGPPVPVTTLKSYSYDDLDRLITAETDQGQAIDYRFDPVGNRLEQAGIPQDVDPTADVEPLRPGDDIANRYAYNEANQLTVVRRQASVVQLAYDDNGNRLEAVETLPNGDLHRTTYSYDYENRLTAVVETLDGDLLLTARYTYDGYGRRVRKEVTQPASATPQSLTYVYNGLDPIADYETVEGVTTAAYYYWANGGIAEIERLPNPATGFSGDVHWSHTDGLGSLVDLTNAAGESVAQVYYDEYGQLLTEFSSLTRYSYTGQEYDPETGLYHFYARYYDPEFGVWLGQDLYRGDILSPLSLHRYAYTANNPITYIDVYGYFWHIAAGGAVGAVKGAVTETVMQVGKNIASGKNPLDAKNYDLASIGAATVGGAVEGAVFAATGNPVLAGTAGGAVTSFVDAKAHGASLGEATTAGLIGGTVGGGTSAAFHYGGKWLKGRLQGASDLDPKQRGVQFEGNVKNRSGHTSTNYLRGTNGKSYQVDLHNNGKSLKIPGKLKQFLELKSTNGNDSTLYKAVNQIRKRSKYLKLKGAVMFDTDALSVQGVKKATRFMRKRGVDVMFANYTGKGLTGSMSTVIARKTFSSWSSTLGARFGTWSMKEASAIGTHFARWSNSFVRNYRRETIFHETFRYSRCEY